MIITWLGYIKSIAALETDPQQLHTESIENILSFNKQFNTFSCHSVPIIYLLNYTTGKYMFMSNSSRIILGYAPGVLLLMASILPLILIIGVI